MSKALALSELATAAAAVRSTWNRIQGKTTKYFNEVNYDIVEAGLFLLKAQGQFATVAKRPNGQFDTRHDGFCGWLTKEFPELSQRTAYNYINAARNCGLTALDGKAAVARLRKDKALAGKKPTDLYRLAKALDDKPPEQMELDLVGDALRNLGAAIAEVKALRGELAHPQYEATCNELQAALEDFTHAKWDMVDARDIIQLETHQEEEAAV